MPTFTTDGQRRFVSIITGPAHVRLGVRFAATPVSSPSIVRTPPLGGCDHGQLDEAALAAAVVSGIAEVSGSLFAAEIIYIADDSPQYSLYSRAAKLLAERFADGLP
jgi:hypothetical protein